MEPNISSLLKGERSTLLTIITTKSGWMFIRGNFNGSLLESYEVLIRDDKVESYRRDYPDAQTGFMEMRCHATSRCEVS